MHTLPRLFFKIVLFAREVCVREPSVTHTSHARTTILQKSLGRVSKNQLQTAKFGFAHPSGTFFQNRGSRVGGVRHGGLSDAHLPHQNHVFEKKCSKGVQKSTPEAPTSNFGAPPSKKNAGGTPCHQDEKSNAKTLFDFPKV